MIRPKSIISCHYFMDVSKQDSINFGWNISSMSKNLTERFIMENENKCVFSLQVTFLFIAQKSQPDPVLLDLCLVILIIWIYVLFMYFILWIWLNSPIYAKLYYMLYIVVFRGSFLFGQNPCLLSRKVLAGTKLTLPSFPLQ